MPATAEPPVTTSAPETPISEVFDRALQDAQAKESGSKSAAPIEKAPPKEVASEKEVAPDDSAKTESASTEKAKPKTALDAAIGDQPKLADDTKPDPMADEIPANAPARLLRDALKRRETEVQHWKAEAAKVSAADPAIKGQLETLMRERDASIAENAKLRDAITALDVRYEPGHQARFGKGKEDLVSKAAGKLKSFGGNPDALAEALALPEGKLRSGAVKEALADLDPDDRLKVVAAIERVEALEEEEASVLKDPQQAWEQMTRKQQEQAQQAHEEAEKNKQAIFERVLKTLPEKAKLLTLVDSSAEGAEKWNSYIVAAHEQAKYLLSADAALDEISAAAVKGSRYDFVEGLLLSERKENRARISQLEEQVAKYEASEPGFRGTPKKQSTGILDKSPGDIYAETLASLSGREV